MKNKKTMSIMAALLMLAFVIPQSASAFDKLFYYFDNTYGYTNFKKNSSQVDTIAPQIYTVGHDLKIKAPKSSSLKIAREASKKKVKVTPLLVNADFSKVLMSTILITPEAQDHIIQYMIDEAKKRNYAGWQFDFENINHLDRDMFTAFVAKTSKALKKENLEFSVAVVPRSVPYDPESANQDWSSGYDYKAIAPYVDFVSIMSYDDPYSVGPVASVPFTKKILTYMKTQIPAGKISLGIPLYCWKWDNQINMRVGSLTQKLALAEYTKGKNKDRGYDENLGAEWFRYTRNGTEYTTWCESEESLKAKFDIIKDEGLYGFSAWAIGQEHTWFWSMLKGY